MVLTAAHEFIAGQPQRAGDAIIEAAFRMFGNGSRCERDAQETVAQLRWVDVVEAEHMRGFDLPARFLERFAPGTLNQRLPLFPVARGLIEQHLAADAFLDGQEATIALYDAGDDDVWNPVHSGNR